MYRNVSVLCALNCAKRNPQAAQCEPGANTVNALCHKGWSDFCANVNAKVRLRIAEELRKVRTTLNASVDAGLMVIAQILIYRFSEVGLAITVENCV
ncbi:hypothetical protein LR61_02435 [Morganella morganii]|nr:hypothetical protein LR61_02435 [Morganella morganii]